MDARTAAAAIDSAAQHDQVGGVCAEIQGTRGTGDEWFSRCCSLDTPEDTSPDSVPLPTCLVGCLEPAACRRVVFIPASDL